MNLSSPIEKIPRIGPFYKKKLKKLGIKTIQDLFFHFPHRYEDFSNLIPISKIKINQTCTVQGKILDIETNRTWKRRIYVTQAIVEDKSGAIKAVWFNQPYLTNVLKKDQNVFLSGKTVIGENGVYLSGPAYEKYSPEQEKDQIHTGRLIPVYPETEGLSSRWIRYILKPLLNYFKNEIPETLPQKIIKQENLMPAGKALFEIHFPSSEKTAKQARERFSFEELFFIELFVLRERARLSREKAAALSLNLEIIQDFIKKLPFKLTDGQKKSSWQILKDLEKPKPMNRLLEGDVGSGKTVVAAIAALNTIKAGWQAAFMAPTEILAKQHFQEISRLFSDFKINIGLLTGKQDQFYSKKLKNQVIEISRQKLLEKTMGEINPITKNLETGIDILIGTHALIQDKVKFGKLGLVILDEQHRFGVEQRARLCQPAVRGGFSGKNKLSGKEEKNSEKPDKFVPHLLSMTATPIPRSLALTIYGDLDLSLIEELPKGRKKIITKVIKPEERKKTYSFIKKEVKKGRQVFVICPRIENQKSKTKNQDDSSKLKTKKTEKELSWAETKAVKEEYEKLSKEIFPNLKIEKLWGKMASKEKERIMKDFKNKKTDILISTSVVEVGIDVPNATVMMIEGAERFGLAQLHQFRGRVGRAKHQSYCLLFSDSHSAKTHQRLKALITSKNGFELAEKDLKIRGPGDFKGTRQWGIPDLMMNSLGNMSLVEKTRQTAKEILAQDPQLKKYPGLQDKLGKFRERIHLE